MSFIKKTLSTLIIILISLNSFTQTNLLSGFIGGSYYQVSNEIALICNDSINVLTSKGNFYNFNELRKDNVDIAFLQYDVLYLGSYGFEEAKNIKNLRLLLPLGTEHIHLITKKDSDINSLDDLSKKKIGIGSRNQGTNITASLIKRAIKSNWKDVEISFEESFTALMGNEIDAFFFVGSSPVAEFNNLDANIAKNLKIVNISHKSLEKIYTPTVISKDDYNWINEDINTICVRYALATNITNENESKNQKIENLLNCIHSNIEKLQKNGHNVWDQVDFDFSKVTAEIHDLSKKIFNIKTEEK